MFVSFTKVFLYVKIYSKKRGVILMKLEYVIKILFDLMSKKTVSATYLAEKYGISKRSVYRYVECLERAGVPLYSVRGKNGGFSVMDTYRLSSTFMTVKEFEATINALTAIENTVPDPILSGAVSKLKATRKNEFSGFEIKSGGLIIDAAPWGDAHGYKSKLAVVMKCIEDDKCLLIRYHDRNGEVTERTVEPHVIVFKQGLFYLYAFCRLRREFRFFKLGRIESATATAESFVKQSFTEADLPLDFWHNVKIAETVEFEVNKRVLSDVEEWLGIENVEKLGDKFIARATLPVDEGLITKLMSFGSGVKVLYPEKLKTKLCAAAKEVLDIYDVSCCDSSFGRGGSGKGKN